MSVVSFEFLVFVIATVTVYFLIPKKCQWLVILAANIAFYAFGGPVYLIYIGSTALITWAMALQLEKMGARGKERVAACEDPEEKKRLRKELISRRKTVVALSTAAALVAWIVLKYTNFFLDTVNGIASLFGAAQGIGKVSWALPLGISYYSMIAVGYLIDIYRGKYPAERNFFRYFTFVSFFPHITQGPFDRYNEVGKQLFAEHRFSYDRLCSGCALILWGVFKKLIIADKLSVPMNTIIGGWEKYPGISIFFAVIMFIFRTYADFSGYMDIVTGVARIMDITLPVNFERPFLSRSIDEYWRRWHITLGAWFRDYLFYPVSMSRLGQRLGKFARKKWGARMGKLLPGYLALFLVWTATGLWHGASAQYLVWGYINFAMILTGQQLADFFAKSKNTLHIRDNHPAWVVISVIRTFLLCCLFRYIVAAPSAGTGFAMIGRTVTAFLPGEPMNLMKQFLPGLSKIEILAVGIGMVMLIASDFLAESGKLDKIAKKCPFPVRNLFWAVLILMLVLAAGGDNDVIGGFMYANF